MQAPRQSLMGTWAGVTSALLLGLLLPSAAQSSCGDYLHLASNRPGADTKADTPTLPLPHKPCSGPSCTRQQSDPLPAPVPPPISAEQDSAQLSTTPVPL